MYSYSSSLLFLYICLYMLVSVFFFTFCCRFHSTNEDEYKYRLGVRHCTGSTALNVC